MGFKDENIRENKVLGLKETTRIQLDQYLQEDAMDQQDENVIIQRDGLGMKEVAMNSQKADGKNDIKKEETDDWAMVSIAPPPKAEVSLKNLVPISSLPEWAQGAFRSTKHLNKIQSRVFKSAFQSSGSLLVAAPTGAGKTNIALLTILREVGRFIPEDATTQKDFSMKHKAFCIIYIAPLKALASEIVDKFSSALSYLDIRVRELTGDMSMTKAEI